jgi:2-methylfumaryl-CoA isomerase
MSNEGILAGMRIIEGSAFVAAPLGGLTLAQLGAEVIRFDQIGGGLDYKRWPVTKNNESLFWSGLNRGKKSIQIDISSESGQKILQELISEKSEEAGIFLTNFPARGWLSYEELSKKRKDLIMISLTGNFDGSSEVDYTVNPAFGYPDITGQANDSTPINHVLPAWDLILGNLAAIAILAAERRRSKTGEGDFIQIALSDVALSVAGSLGRLSQAYLREERPLRDGNFLYGSFGHNFTTADGRQIMLVGLTSRQWKSLISTLNLEAEIKELETNTQLSLSIEGNRFALRESVRGIIQRTVSKYKFSELEVKLKSGNVSWSAYQSFEELIDSDYRASIKNPIFSIKNQPNIGEIPNIASPIRFKKSINFEPENSPRLGEHTDQVLKKVLGLSELEIATLRANQVIA